MHECQLCGLFQAVPRLAVGTTALCRRCGAQLRHQRSDPAGRALALAATGLLMFGLAASLPLLRLDLGGSNQPTHLTGGPEALEQHGMWELALVVLGTTMLAPALKLGATVWVLAGLYLHRPPSHLRPVFRLVERLTPWSMIEVFMLGVFVAYTKLGDIAPVHVGGAVYALGGLMLAMAAADSALDHEAIWERLEQDRRGLEAAASGPGQRIGCDECGFVSRRAARRHACPRCGAALHHRKPHSLSRSWALLIAAVIMYIPANLLPVTTVVQLGRGQPDTILSGVEELATAGQWPLAALVFVASITVPLLKILGLGTLLITTQLGATSRLRERSLLFRIVDAVGRWSMIDVFMISLLTALVQAGNLVSITPGPGVLCFCAVVILTMLAAESFDPRLMWDAAERTRARGARQAPAKASAPA